MIVSSFLDNAAVESKPEIEERIVLVCGTVSPVIEDVIKFVEVVRLEDVLADHGPYACLMFSDDVCEIIEMVVDHPLIFPFRLVVLAGVPDCVYSPTFEKACYNRAKISFYSLVNDFREEHSQREKMDREGPSIYEAEQARITRANGTKKEVGEFLTRTSNPDADESAESENEEP